eukprot:gene23805-32194_t
MKSSESDSYDDDDCNSQFDEVQQIKIAMREAKARKKTLSKKLQQHTDRSNADKSELESIVKLRTEELSQCRQLLGECELQLREAHYEIKQLQSRIEKRVEEGNEEAKYFKDTISELRSALAASESSSTTRNKVIFSECEKLGNFVGSLLRSTLHGTNQLSPRTSQQILQRISSDIIRLKDYLLSTGIDFPPPASSPTAMPSTLSSMLPRTATMDTNDEKLHSPSHSFDSTLLDMCRSLEEENVQLADTVSDLRMKLQESQRETSVNKLIPHYRLAIIRSKAYAANLQEQIKREKKRDLQKDERKQALYAETAAAESKGFPNTMPDHSVVGQEERDDEKVEQIRQRHSSHRGFRYASLASDASADRYSSLDSRARDLPEGRSSQSIRSSSATDPWRRPLYQQKRPQQQKRDEYEYEEEDYNEEEDEEDDEEESDDDGTGFDSLTHSLRASKESQTVAHQLKDELTTLDVEIGSLNPYISSPTGFILIALYSLILEELKEKLAAAARSESQSILKAVLEAKFSTEKTKS